MTMDIMRALTLVDTEVKRVCEPDHAYIVQIKQNENEGGFGVVLIRRNTTPHPYVVWRWATEYTDGSPVDQGAMLWSGNYLNTYEEAVSIFDGLLPR